jgi:hypothetical protein
VRGVFGRDRVSERRACRVIGQSRSTQRRTRRVPDDEPRLVKRIVWLACEYGRYGYRRITVLLHWKGCRVRKATRSGAADAAFAQLDRFVSGERSLSLASAAKVAAALGLVLVPRR